MDPWDRLKQSQEAAAEGRYAEALRGYEWFHHNALKHRPSLYGVRLSFALSYWIELGKHYPKARHALGRIARRKTVALLGGRGGREVFHDVEAINGYLNKHRDTYRLFVRLESSRPRLAKASARLALPTLVRAGDFKRARRHTPDPESQLRRYAEFLNRELPRIPQLKRKAKTKAPMREAYIANYCDDARLLIRVLRGAGEREKAAALRRSAVAMIEMPSARRDIAKRLSR